MPPSPQISSSKPNSMMSSPLSPITQMSTSLGLSNSVMSPVPHPTPFSNVVPMSGAPAMPIKREILFPPDSVEAVVPVLGRKKKLHKVRQAPNYFKTE